MKARQTQWVLTDVQTGTWTNECHLTARDLGWKGCPGVEVNKRTLHGGLSEGVESVEIKNGALEFTVLPTRGMGLWRAGYRGVLAGWRSPVKGPVHPRFVHAGENGGTGWLQGFDETVVRCGLAWNGHPGPDRVGAPGGAFAEKDLTLHGRIANQPAHRVEVGTVPGDPPALFVRGWVDEAALFGPQLGLDTTFLTWPDSNRLVIRDRITNLQDTEAEMQVLYHCNFGPPILDEGATVAVPARLRGPFDRHAAKDIAKWDTYRGPTPGLAEQCYWHVPLADAGGRCVALLKNAAGDRGVAVRFDVSTLPFFTVWKNTAGVNDGYVTGLEPATNIPNARAFEREHGRVVRLAPGAVYQTEVTLEIFDRPRGIQDVEREIARIQSGHRAVIRRAPDPQYSPRASRG